MSTNNIKNESDMNSDIVSSNNKNIDMLPWIEKYRPVTVDGILYNDFIVNCINNFLKQQKLPNLLFYGPPGTGKTSLITTIAKKYYGNNYHTMTLMINASVERGIETIRNIVKDFSASKPMYEGKKNLPFKLVILDEIDSMTPDAQSILKKVIQRYTKVVRFCLICNINNKIDAGIISRCTVFRFKPFAYDCLHKFIRDICEKEDFKISKKSADLIIKKSSGDLRRLLNILQSIKMYISNKNITNKIVKESITSEVLCSPLNKTILNIISFIQNNSLKESVDYFTDIIKEDVIPLSEFIDSIFTIIKDRIINDDTEIIKFSIDKSSNIIKYLNDVNNNLNNCDSEIFQISAFISCFYLE
jgi:replication factor C subunit 3/5